MHMKTYWLRTLAYLTAVCLAAACFLTACGSEMKDKSTGTAGERTGIHTMDNTTQDKSAEATKPSGSEAALPTGEKGTVSESGTNLQQNGTQALAANASTSTAQQVTPAEAKDTPTAAGQESQSQPGAVNNSANNRNTGKVTIYIDPGHQSISEHGVEPIAPSSSEMKQKMTLGTTGVVTGIPEYTLNMNVSIKLKDALIKAGYNVLMTHETNDVNISNVERAVKANESGADLVVRIHANGLDNSSVKGLLVMCPGKKYISDTNVIKDSRNAAQKILDSVIASTGARSLGVVESDEMTGFNWSTVPVMLIEMGFMTNAEEDRLLNSDIYQQKIVKGIVDGINRYIAER